jgi:nucleoside-diphosphate-sugar epimerase
MCEQRRVLVTGAGGFIGGRVVEVLHLSGRPVRAGIRRWASAARIGRFPVDITMCDVTDPKQVSAALDGVEAVVHCAGGSTQANVAGTECLLRTCAERGVKRFVHLSSVAVYGEASGDVDETWPLLAGGEDYGAVKAEGERLCRQYGATGLGVVILRPSIVYGPFSAAWTIEFAQRLTAGAWLLPDRFSRGTCNLLYIDDLVQAIILALDQESGVGEAFNISGTERVTWGEYFGALSRAMGLGVLEPKGAIVSRLASGAMMPVRRTGKWVLKHFQRPIMALYQRYGSVKTVLKGLEGMIRQTPTTAEFELYSRDSFFRIDKARRMLGYEPAFTMERGVALSAAWLKHHGYVEA